MKTIVPNDNGTFTIWDEDQDGFWNVIWARFTNSLPGKKWYCLQCKRKYKSKKEAEECCWICKCGAVIHGIHPALEHATKCKRKKNGKKQTGKSVQ